MFIAKQFVCNLTDIIALISIFRKIDPDTTLLKISQPDTDSQDIHLSSGIIDVVLPVYFITNCLKQVRNNCTISGTTSMTYMQRTRWVG